MLKRLATLIVLVALSIATTACGGAARKDDADRYVRGEYDGTIIASPILDATSWVYDGATYVVCDPASQVVVVTLNVDLTGDITTEASTLRPEIATCGNVLVLLTESEKTLGAIRTMAYDPYTESTKVVEYIRQKFPKR